MGRPLVNPIAQESLGVLTQQGGYLELVPRGAELPFPKDGESATYRGLVVPRDLMREVQIVVVAGGPEKPLGIERLMIPEVRSAGAPIHLSVRLDANKLLTVRAELVGHPDAHCTVTLENPLCAVAFGSPRQQEIAELEDGLAGGDKRRPGSFDTVKRERLAHLYQEDGKLERAIEEARKTMEADGKPSEWLLNTIATCYQKLGAPERAEKHLREALRIAPGSAGTRFNLSLHLSRRGRGDEALTLMDEAVNLEPGEPVYRGWRGMLWQQAGRASEGTAAIRQAAAELDCLPSLNPWQRHWRHRFAESLGDTAAAARLARVPDQASSAHRRYDEDRLPGQTGSLAKRRS